MTAAVRYRVRTWANYNQSLINRGNLMIWFDDDIMQAWNAVEPNGQRGREKIFSDLAIECALTLRRLFRLGRYKAILGAGLRSRRMAAQITEARIGAKIINCMTHLGMPKSYKV